MKNKKVNSGVWTERELLMNRIIIVVYLIALVMDAVYYGILGFMRNIVYSLKCKVKE